MGTEQIAQEIQYTLAPAIMISSSALLLLGFQNKFSSLFNRFRALNQEKRNLSQKTGRDAQESIRLENLQKQLPRLMRRARFVKNAILAAYAAILSFITTSILIFLNIYSQIKLTPATIASFLVGLALILASSVFMMIETAIAFHILRLEEKS